MRAAECPCSESASTAMRITERPRSEKASMSMPMPETGLPFPERASVAIFQAAILTYTDAVNAQMSEKNLLIDSSRIDGSASKPPAPETNINCYT